MSLVHPVRRSFRVKRGSVVGHQGESVELMPRVCFGANAEAVDPHCELLLSADSGRSVAGELMGHRPIWAITPANIAVTRLSIRSSRRLPDAGPTGKARGAGRSAESWRRVS